MLNEILNDCKQYSKIVVTGAQRSGTTIAAEILAKELNYKLIDEVYFQVDNFERFMSLFDLEENFVIQAPGLCHLIPKMPENCLKIFMLRNINDIIISQERIQWTEKFEQFEKDKFLLEFPYLKNDNFFEFSPISVTKRIFWNLFKENNLKNYKELEYNSLSEHQLFIQKEERKNFAPKQTKI